MFKTSLANVGLRCAIGGFLMIQAGQGSRSRRFSFCAM